MGSIWDGLGEVVGGIWSLLGPLGSFWALLFSRLYLEWTSEVLLEAPGLGFGSIFEGLGRILGGFWEAFGRSWEGFSSILGDSGCFCLLLLAVGVANACYRLLLLAFACFCLLLLAFICFCLLLFAFA